MRKLIKTVTSADKLTADVVQHDRRTFSLTVTSRRVGRNRWGTAKEIERDAAFFERHNHLPPPAGRRW